MTIDEFINKWSKLFSVFSRDELIEDMKKDLLNLKEDLE